MSHSHTNMRLWLAPRWPIPAHGQAGGTDSHADVATQTRTQT